MNPPDQPSPTSLARLALDRAERGGDRPFLTFHDLETGERTELGHATFANWTAKTANLLVADLGLAPGARVALSLGGHWTAAVAAVAAWRAGLTVDVTALTASLGAAGPQAPAAVAIVREDLDGSPAAETFVVGRALGARLSAATAAGEPFADEVLAQDDHFADVTPGPHDPAVRTSADSGEVDHTTVCAAGTDLAARLGLTSGDRLLSTLPVDRLDGLLAGLVCALVADVGLVLVAGGGPSGMAAQIADAERCTHAVAGADDDVADFAIPVVRCTVSATLAVTTEPVT